MSAPSLRGPRLSALLPALLLVVLLLCHALPSCVAVPNLWVQDLTSGFTLPNSFSPGFSQNENIEGNLGSWLDASYDTSQPAPSRWLSARCTCPA